MQAKWRVQITLISGAQIRVEAAEFGLHTNADGNIEELHITNADGSAPRLAYARLSDIAAIVVEEIA